FTRLAHSKTPISGKPEIRWARLHPGYKRSGLLGDRRRFPDVLEIIVPDLIEAGERLAGRRHAQMLAVALEQPEAVALAERVVDLEIDLDTERRLEPALDRVVELGLGRRRLGNAQEIVGEERLLAFLVLGGADDVVEYPGIVVDVAEVDVVGQLLLVLERLRL